MDKKIKISKTSRNLMKSQKFIIDWNLLQLKSMGIFSTCLFKKYFTKNQNIILQITYESILFIQLIQLYFNFKIGFISALWTISRWWTSFSTKACTYLIVSVYTILILKQFYNLTIHIRLYSSSINKFLSEFEKTEK